MDVILVTALTVGWSSAPPIATRQFTTPSVLAFQPANWRCGAVRLSAEQDDVASPPAADPAIEALRERQMKNLLAITLLSLGTPMLGMGDDGVVVRYLPTNGSTAGVALACFCEDG